MVTAELPIYTKKDFQTDQEVRWCPGCGDYAILNAVQSVFPELGIRARPFCNISLAPATFLSRSSARASER